MTCTADPVMTHAELVERAVRWLLNSANCSVAFSEMRTAGGEIPDAIGFQSYQSTLVECKVSRSDFLRDRQKFHRVNARHAMGSRRYYMVPAGMVAADELPEKWGLLHVQPRGVKVVRVSGGFPDRAYVHEIAFLVSMLRRIEIRVQDRYGENGKPCDFLNQWIKSR